VDVGLIPWLHSTYAADYHLPTFGPHGTKLGHSWYQWKIKSDFSGWLDNSKNGEVSGQIQWIGGWSRGCTPPQECWRLRPTYFWTTWHQTRAFLISVNNKSNFSSWFDNSKKGDVSWQIKWMGGGVDPVVALHLRRAAEYRLPTFGPHGTKTEHFWYQWIINVIFLAGLIILKKEMCLGRLSGLGVDPVVALHLRNAADYRLPTFGPHGTKLGHSWYQWIIKVIFLAGLTILNKERCLGRLSGLGVDPVVALHLRNA